MRVSDYRYADIIHRCFRCGYCKFPEDWSDVTNCPAYARYRMESWSSGGRLWLIRAWVTGEIEWSPYLAKIVYACTACGNCVEKCPLAIADDIVNMVVAARSEMAERGLVPPAVRDVLTRMQQRGNPFGLPAKNRGQWAEDLPVEKFSGQDYLLYIGADGSYDTRAQQAARALARLLEKAGVSFGILGEYEPDDGNDVAFMGEEGLAAYLMEQAVARFRELGVKQVITLSPHALYAFTAQYPTHGGDFRAYHYTQVLSEQIRTGALPAPKNREALVTYHDPCFLGRWSSEYKAPRKVLGAIGGLQVTEMARSRKSSLCCGGGSGNCYTDLLGGSKDSPARIRVRQAAETGAGILATACPNCLVMLEDAVRAEGIDDKLAVRDISEVFCQASGIAL